MSDRGYFDHIIIRVGIIIMIIASVFIFSSLGYNRKLIIDNQVILQQIEHKLNLMHIDIIRQRENR